MSTYISPLRKICNWEYFPGTNRRHRIVRRVKTSAYLAPDLVRRLDEHKKDYFSRSRMIEDAIVMWLEEKEKESL